MNLKKFLAYFRAVQMIISLIVALTVMYLWVLNEIDWERAIRTIVLGLTLGILDPKNAKAAIGFLRYLGNYKQSESDENS